MVTKKKIWYLPDGSTTDTYQPGAVSDPKDLFYNQPAQKKAERAQVKLAQTQTPEAPKLTAVTQVATPNYQFTPDDVSLYNEYKRTGGNLDINSWKYYGSPIRTGDEKITPSPIQQQISNERATQAPVPQPQSITKESLKKLFAPAYAEGIKRGESEDITTQNILKQIQTDLKNDPNAFFDYLLKQNLPDEMNALLKSMGATDAEVSQITATQFTDQKLVATIGRIPAFKDMTLEQVMELANKDVNLFISNLLSGGITADEKNLLIGMGLTPEQVSNIIRGNPYSIGKDVNLKSEWMNYKAPTFKTPAGNTATYKMTDAEWNSMTPWEQAYYKQSPTSWLTNRTEFSKQRVVYDRFKIISEDILGIKVNPQTPLDYVMNVVNAALWVVPIPLAKILKPLEKLTAGVHILPEEIRAAVEPLEEFLTKVRGIKPEESKVSGEVLGKIKQELDKPLKVETPKIVPKLDIDSVVNKIVKRETLTIEEQQFRLDNAKAIEDALKGLRTEPVVKAPLTDALIKDGDTLIKQAEKINPTDVNVAKFKKLVEEAKLAPTPELQRAALRGMEDTEQAVRDVIRSQEAKAIETRIAAEKASIASQKEGIKVFRTGREQGEVGSGTFYFIGKKPSGGNIPFNIETEINPRNVLKVADKGLDAPSLSLAQEWFPNRDFLSEAQKQFGDELEYSRITDKLVADEARKRGYDAIQYGDKIIQVLSHQVSNESITQKLTRLIKEAKPARKETELLKHEELKNRVAQAASILEKGQGAEAFQRSKGALKGMLPQADFIVDLKAAGITDSDIADLFNTINKGETLSGKHLRYFDKLNTADALQRLLNGQIPQEAELVLLENMFGSDLVKAILDKLSLGEHIRSGILEVLNIPRTLQTIGDLSGSLRQGLVLAFGQPVQWSKAFVGQLKVVFSSKNAILIDNLIHSGKYADLMDDSGLYRAPLGKAAPKIGAREEAFMSHWIERVPVIGSIVRSAERAYVTFLNVLRTETFEYWASRWEGTGKSVEDYKKLAKFINHATGRGDLGKMSGAAEVLNIVFYSPRYLASRVQVPLDLFTSTPAVRKVVARNLIAMVAGGMSVLGLAKLAGAEVEDDWRSSDFGKVKIGNTRYDFWGGFIQYARLVGQLITGERKSTASGAISELNRLETISTFVQYKLSPAAGLVTDILRGKTILGEELSTEPSALEKQAYERLTPMFIQDMIDAINESGLREGSIKGSPSVLGIGVQTYENNWNTNLKKLGMPETSIPFSGAKIPVYQTSDFYSDTSSMIGNASSSSLEGKQGVPEIVVAVARTKEINHILSRIPSGSLRDLNTDPLNGATYEDYYNQWQERLKLEGDAEALKEFDKKYPNAEKGNFTRRELSLLKERSLLTTEKDRRAFDKAHPEAGVNKRNEYLKANPKENAYLALFGVNNTKILTKEAYNEVQKLIKELDIPDSAVPDLQIPKESVDNYFKYQDMVAENKNSSWEAQLMLKKDDTLRKFLKLKEIDTPLASLELKVKNRANFDKLEGFSDENSPDYIADEKKRAEAIKKFKSDNPAFVDDMRRIEAIEKGTDKSPVPDTIIKAHVDYGKLQDEEGVGSSSAKSMLFRVDNPEYDKWRQDKGVWGDNALKPIDESKIPIWRIDVKYQKEDTEYEAIKNELPALQAKQREEYLKAHPEYAKDRRRREALQLSNSATGVKFPANQVENYVAYTSLADKGFRKERYLMENPDFAIALKNSGKLADLPNKVPDVAYDDIYDKYSAQFDELDGIGSPESQYFIPDPKTREARASALRFSGGQYTEFGLAEIRRNAYGKYVPPQHVESYVKYYKIIGEGKGKDYEAKNKTDLWYEDDWFLIENQDFYKNVYLNPDYNDGKPRERKDFTKVPTRDVFKKYLEYVKLSEGYWRELYRKNNPDLDAWGQIKFGWKPIQKTIRAGNAQDKLNQDVQNRLNNIEGMR